MLLDWHIYSSIKPKCDKLFICRLIYAVCTSNCFCDIQDNLLYTTRPIHIYNMYWNCSFLVLNLQFNEQSDVIFCVNWRKNEWFWKRITCNVIITNVVLKCQIEPILFSNFFMTIRINPIMNFKVFFGDFWTFQFFSISKTFGLLFKD